MNEIYDTAKAEEAALTKLIFSDFRGRDRTVRLRRVALSDPALIWQAEELRENKAFQKNLTREGFFDYLSALCEEGAFRQANFFLREEEISFRISKKGKILKNRRKTGPLRALLSGNNEEKNYLLPEGADAPFMRDLGLFTENGAVVRARYDKFRQINRFLEVLDHALKDEEKEEICVVDFGCGRSYLTFLVYYYFSVLKKRRVKIIGYDLKREVVEECSALAKKYGYNGLTFEVADVTRDRLTEREVDMVISLHACDTATDYALDFAMRKGARYSFSVPCCQHEIDQTIKKGGEFDLMLDHGIFKERFSALLTDAIRVKVLEEMGWKTDVLEFVDFAHSPKNLMLRARRAQKEKTPDFSAIRALEEKYAFRQTLFHLVEERMAKTDG